MIENMPTTMRGSVVDIDPQSGSFVGTMFHPSKLTGVLLTLDSLFFTRGYPNSDGARTRITDLGNPDIAVRLGDPIVASIVTVTEPTGHEILNPAYSFDNRRVPVLIPEMRVLFAFASKWGLRGIPQTQGATAWA